MQKLLLAAMIVLAACAAPSRTHLEPGVAVQAKRETAAVSARGDAADDPAIWVAPDPAQSLVIATQKQGGLYVFDLAGAIHQDIPGGLPNNVDLRAGWAWPEGEGPIVGASDRGDNTLPLWRFDPVARRLDPTPRARIVTGFREVYGFCLGRLGADAVAIATDRNTGEIGVWRISAEDGALRNRRIATYRIGSITEGCVVDDARGLYYIADELHGIWEVALDDSTGTRKRLIDRVGRGGHLVADVEGLSLWLGEGEAGYLVASVQGASRFAVYDRVGHAYRGAFSVVASADGAADPVTGTDGVDIVSAALGADYPSGLVVVQDTENTDPPALQNFKYVSWADIAAALDLR